MKRTVNIIGLLLIAAAIASRWLPIHEGSDDKARSAAEQAAADVPRLIATLQAEHYASVAAQLRDGTLSGDVESGNWLRERNKAAIDAAYLPLDTLLQESLGEGRWTNESAAEIYEAVGRGLLSAAERLD